MKQMTKLHVGRSVKDFASSAKSPAHDHKGLKSPVLFYLVFRKGEKVVNVTQLFVLARQLKGFLSIGLPIGILIGHLNTKTGIISAAFFLAALIIIGPSLACLYLAAGIVSGAFPDLKQKRDFDQLKINPTSRASLAKKSAPAMHEQKRVSALSSFLYLKNQQTVIHGF